VFGREEEVRGKRAASQPMIFTRGTGRFIQTLKRGNRGMRSETNLPQKEKALGNDENEGVPQK